MRHFSKNNLGSWLTLSKTPSRMKAATYLSMYCPKIIAWQYGFGLGFNAMRLFAQYFVVHNLIFSCGKVAWFVSKLYRYWHFLDSSSYNASKLTQFETLRYQPCCHFLNLQNIKNYLSFITYLDVVSSKLNQLLNEKASYWS